MMRNRGFREHGPKEIDIKKKKRIKYARASRMTSRVGRTRVIVRADERNAAKRAIDSTTKLFLFYFFFFLWFLD